MTEPVGLGLCRVCRQRAADYTCPRCNARYCSLECYRQHSDRCTEGFYRDAAMSELRGMTAGEDEKRRMMEILQRLHQEELEGGSGGSSGSSGEDEDEDEGEEGDGEGLSAQTLHRLFAKLQASGGTLEVGPQDLTPAELAAFHRALAAGELNGAVQPWEPWWLSQEATQLELSASGTALVAVVGQQAAGSASAPQQAEGGSNSSAGTENGAAGAGGAGGGSSGGGGLPAPPSRPLPRLSALTKAAPSPLLQYQLLDVLYSYCFTLRRYNGDYHWEAADAADTLFFLSAVLTAVAAPAAAAGGSQSLPSNGSNGDAFGAAAPVLLGCIQRACQPPVGTRDGRGFAVGVVSDVAAILQLGRAVVLTALMDTSRLVEAARQQLEAARSSSSSSSSSRGNLPDHASSRKTKQQRKELRGRLVAAERKLLFFLAWANEQPPMLYDLLAAAAAAEHQQHTAAMGHQPAAASTQGGPVAGSHTSSGVGGGGVGSDHAPPPGSVWIEEI